MNASQYNADLDRLKTENLQNLTGMADWALNDAMPWLWSELSGIVGRRVSPLKSADAIRQGLQITYADRLSMPLKQSFYIAQLTMMDAEVRNYCGAAKAFAAAESPPYADATIHTLHRALASHLAHGLVLLEQASHALLQLPGMFGSWSRRYETPFEIFKGAEQSTYGTYSWMTHADRAPYTPIAVLRTAIELRIRGAFGIQGYVDPSNNSLVPIDLGRLFEAIQPRLQTVDFAVDFHDVRRVYRWSNFYLHGGWRDFEWVAGFALQYLRPLFADNRQTPTGGWSINGGIRMRRADWREIRLHFRRAGNGEDRPWLQRMLWKAQLLIRGRSPRALLLNEADESLAQCVFLD